MTTIELYTSVKASGIPIDHHESDLYMPVTPLTRALVAEYEFKGNVTRFTASTGGAWFDVPFAYQPWWDKMLGVAA